MSSSATTSPSPDPTPKTITGGCLCSSLRYEITFPPSHDFVENTCVCQCTQCRKQTGGFFYASYSVHTKSLKWTSDTADKLKKYHATDNISRGFCGNCGSFLFWYPDGRDMISLAIGSVDPFYLFGEGAEETDNGAVPKEGFGRVLCSGLGNIEFCSNDIKGITDEMPLLLRGKRYQGDSSDC
ncbi:glutathione-dependent formaldehyde-activating GFA [Dactylonectria macrodidyma]|uniref:Glutathione-dependent formaldehyde-activating GFA n=1 Tax=Dactylonectria macrodidyma TaxID=307937 RepID=A0A9P9IGL5_9HYPO|nr:glutathione-dependent formaldehyde-activating GFA [Dactylonectria macrodidyma]